MTFRSPMLALTALLCGGTGDARRGMGSDRPVAENTNGHGRANNRRVEIVIAKTSGRAAPP